MRVCCPNTFGALCRDGAYYYGVFCTLSQRKSLAGAEAQLMEKATRCSILEEWNAELSQSLDEKERHSVTEKTDATHTYEAMRSELSATIKRLEVCANSLPLFSRILGVLLPSYKCHLF